MKTHAFESFHVLSIYGVRKAHGWKFRHRDDSVTLHGWFMLPDYTKLPQSSWICLSTVVQLRLGAVLALFLALAFADRQMNLNEVEELCDSDGCS